MRKRLATSAEPFRIYWGIYGGFKELRWSPYLWCAVLLTAACAPLWLNVDMLDEKRPAIDIVITVVPALMAFTLAGMAVILALSGKSFLTAIREEGDPKSLFMRVIALFFHFLLIQTIALVFAMLSRTYVNFDPLAGVAFFFAAYGIMSAVAIAAMLLNVSRIYNVTGGLDDDKP